MDENRVIIIRKELKSLGVKYAKYLFTRKFREYEWKEYRDKDWNRLDNLWHGKIQDEEFLKKLESFLRYKKQEFKKEQQ